MGVRFTAVQTVTATNTSRGRLIPSPGQAVGEFKEVLNVDKALADTGCPRNKSTHLSRVPPSLLVVFVRGLTQS